MLRLDYIAYAVITLNLLAALIFHLVTRKDRAAPTPESQTPEPEIKPAIPTYDYERTSMPDMHLPVHDSEPPEP